MNKLIKKKSLNDKFLQKCKSSKCFSAVSFDEFEFETFKYQKPLNFFLYFWKKYENFRSEFINKYEKPPNNQFSGAALGIIITYLFNREGIKIDYMDEVIEEVPFVKPDYIITSKTNKKFFVSIKVSARERWKQADWEAIKYKKKYPDALCILLINDKAEYLNIKKFLPFIDLDYIYYAGSKDINKMIKLIKN
jgi:hypothetical protein